MIVNAKRQRAGAVQNASCGSWLTGISRQRLECAGFSGAVGRAERPEWWMFPVRTKAVLKSPQSKRSASSGDDQISRSVLECAIPSTYAARHSAASARRRLALCRAKRRRDFRVNFDHPKSTEPLPLFLDRNWPVGFHKPTMNAVNGKVGHAQGRACSAA